jgi:hypothetical protein
VLTSIFFSPSARAAPAALDDDEGSIPLCDGDGKDTKRLRVWVELPGAGLPSWILLLPLLLCRYESFIFPLAHFQLLSLPYLQSGGTANDPLPPTE